MLFEDTFQNKQIGVTMHPHAADFRHLKLHSGKNLQPSIAVFPLASYQVALPVWQGNCQ